MRRPHHHQLNPHVRLPADPPAGRVRASRQAPAQEEGANARVRRDELLGRRPVPAGKAAPAVVAVGHALAGDRAFSLQLDADVVLLFLVLGEASVVLAAALEYAPAPEYMDKRSSCDPRGNVSTFLSVPLVTTVTVS